MRKSMNGSLGGKILVPLDGSPVSERVLPHAQQWAMALRTEVLLFQVDLPIGGMLLAAPEVLPPDEITKLRRQRVMVYFREVAARISLPGLSINYQVYTLPSVDTELEEMRAHIVEAVSSEIIQRAAEPDVGMVVMGVHRARPLDEVGGISNRIVEECNKPVLVIPF